MTLLFADRRHYFVTRIATCANFEKLYDFKNTIVCTGVSGGQLSTGPLTATLLRIIGCNKPKSFKPKSFDWGVWQYGMLKHACLEAGHWTGAEDPRPQLTARWMPLQKRFSFVLSFNFKSHVRLLPVDTRYYTTKHSRRIGSGTCGTGWVPVATSA